MTFWYFDGARFGFLYLLPIAILSYNSIFHPISLIFFIIDWTYPLRLTNLVTKVLVIAEMEALCHLFPCILLLVPYFKSYLFCFIIMLVDFWRALFVTQNTFFRTFFSFTIVGLMISILLNHAWTTTIFAIFTTSMNLIAVMILRFRMIILFATDSITLWLRALCLAFMARFGA